MSFIYMYDVNSCFWRYKLDISFAELQLLLIVHMSSYLFLRGRGHNIGEAIRSHRTNDVCILLALYFHAIAFPIITVLKLYYHFIRLNLCILIV